MNVLTHHLTFIAQSTSSFSVGLFTHIPIFHHIYTKSQVFVHHVNGLSHHEEKTSQFLYKSPVKFISHETSNCVVGESVHIPTLPSS